MSKYCVISGPYFPVFELNTNRYEVSLRIQSKYRNLIIQSEYKGRIWTLFTQWELLKISHNPVMFGEHRHCGSDDIMALVFQVISPDHVIKESCNFMGRTPSS